MSKKLSVGIVIVVHNTPEQLKKLLTSLKTQIQAGDYLVVVDNHPKHSSAKITHDFKEVNKLILSENNGFAAGCNSGVGALPKNINTVFFINPDTTLGLDALNRLRTNIPDEWSAWMGLLVKKDGLVNSAGNVVHMSGLSWCDGFNDQPSEFTNNLEVSILSGACLMIRKNILDKIGGMPDGYFLYYEDTELSTRLLLEGKKMGLIHNALIYHDYDFSKSKTKWFYIEKNRYIYILRNWPLAVIILLFPYLVLVDLGLFIVSIIERRFFLKLQSLGSFIKAVPNTLHNRKEIQKTKKITSYIFLKTMATNIHTEQLGSPKKFFVINGVSYVYQKICLLILLPFR